MSHTGDTNVHVCNHHIHNTECKKKCNGDAASHELILIFGLTENATNVHDALLQWLFRCLDTISDKVFNGQYEWNIISQIRDNGYEDDTKVVIKNTIVVAIHISDHSSMSYANTDMTIVPYAYSANITLRPTEIMDCLVNEPVFINNIGVSAVSSDVMMDWWAEMISTLPNCFDVAGKGYMIHPMWMKQNEELNDAYAAKWGSWVSVREMSYNFEWKGYFHHIKSLCKD